MPPKSIAHYELLEPIGKGGMGEVYRARDTKLNRDVALKILPEAFATDRDRMARFEREAQVLASLNHPNIAGIHGIEEEDGARALVLELVKGETLAARLERGPIPLEEVLAIARQIAEALEAAHDVGIIHRDLKPANVIVTDDGRVKVLDFGLAKALDAIAEDNEVETSPTLSFAATRAGVILGTAAYMSPEQARGHKADRRSDVWSFGVVMYEMLSGRRLFEGDTPSDVLARVLTADPDCDALDAPRAIRHLVQRCLRREPKKRLQAIGEARIAIEEYQDEPEPVVPLEAQPRRTRLLPWVVSAAAVLVLVATLVSRAERDPQGDAPVPMRVSMSLDSGGVGLFEHSAIDGAAVVLSPDGTTLAFVGRTEDDRRRLFVRALDQLEATGLDGTDGAFSPFFSPDGRWLAFFADGALKRVATSGGTSFTIADATDARGGAWGADDTIVFTPNFTDGLYRVPASGGRPVALTELREGERSHRWPWVLPGGDGVLFVAQRVGQVYDEGSIEIVSLDTGERSVVFEGATFPRYVPFGSSGHLLFVRDTTVFAAPFDADRLALEREPSPVLVGVRRLVNGAGQFSISNAGNLVYLPGDDESSLNHLALATRSGELTLLYPDAAIYARPSLSPDATKIAVSIGEGSRRDVHLFDLERRTMSRLTFDAARNADPTWTPDGAHIFFSSDAYGGSVSNIYRIRTDGTGAPERLTTSDNPEQPLSVSPDGRHLLYVDRSANTGSDLLLLSLEGTSEPTPFLATPDNETDGEFSPDGRWIAYASDESGDYRVYVEAFPGPGAKIQASSGVGRSPRWSKGGREIIYHDGSQWMAVDVTVEGRSIRAGNPEFLFEGQFAGFGVWPFYDVSSDGERFVVVALDRAADDTHVVLVSDFFGEIRRLTGR